MVSKNRVGEIVLLEFPYTNYKGSKIRPGLILSDRDVEGDNLSDYIVAYITTENDSYASSEFAMMFDIGNLESGYIKEKSTIRIDKSIPVQKDQILRTNVARLNQKTIQAALRMWSKLVVKNYYNAIHKPVQAAPFIPGKSRISFAGRVFDEKEMVSLVNASLDFWLTAGRYAAEFEKKFAAFIGVRHCSLTNSGSSANLLAFMALTSPKLRDRRIKPGDEVITVAAGFPTTVTPIIQHDAVPVFVDVTLPTYNIDCDQLESALSGKTKAVMLAHTLGNPFDIARVLAFCRKHNLWLIEDCCDALGSTCTLKSPYPVEPGSLAGCSPGATPNSPLYTPASDLRPPTSGFCGTFGDLATFSFYPAHHITMGEGGAVCTNDSELKKIVESFRDWGRDCWCAPGRDNTCGRRFAQQFGELPEGYDHKYVYSHFGYNLKVTDMQAAIGCAQLEKLPYFIEARKKNWNLLREGLWCLSDYFVLPEPTPESDPSWFGFLITVKEDVGFTRDQIVAHLEKAGIQTRMLFAGNLIKHPCFDEMRSSGLGFRIASSPNSQLPVTDRIMRDTFWIGVYPGLTEEMINYIIENIKKSAKTPLRQSGENYEV